MKTAKELAESIADKWTRLDGEDREDAVEAMVEAIEADRAQRAAGEPDPIIPADEKFPDRPQHLDFARLSAAAELVDNYPEELSPPKAIGIDDDSLSYMAVNRMGAGIGALGPLALFLEPTVTLAAAWSDGLAVGIEYHRRGGSRPAETGNTAGEGSAK